MKSLSNQFKPLSTFVDPDKSDKKQNQESRLFQLNDFFEGVSERNRSFSFDSENARNFDKDNINKAKQGVKELIADAISKAKTDAIKIKNQALEEGKSTGYEEGIKSGFQDGENKAKEEFIPLLQTINSLTRELSEFRTMIYPKVEKEMIEMVTGLTKKILQYEIETKEDSVKQMILLAINSVINKENMTIRINPSDKAHAEAFSPELKNLFSEIKNINFEEHSGIEKGGCIIDTNFGTIDARVDQLEDQIDKILKLTPAVPVISSDSKPLPEKISVDETEGNAKSNDSETHTSVNETKVSDESNDSETPNPVNETEVSDESNDSETPNLEKPSKDFSENED